MALKGKWFKDKLAKKASRGLRGYPIASVAFYGPDDRQATKVAVGIIESEGGSADVLERWFARDVDVRNDPDIMEAIVRFVEAQGVKTIAMSDRIIGCPHEEGIDYPEGEACPQCPFWEGRDRWTGEVLR